MIAVGAGTDASLLSVPGALDPNGRLFGDRHSAEQIGEKAKAFLHDQGFPYDQCSRKSGLHSGHVLRGAGM